MTRDKTDIGEAVLKLEKVEDELAGAVRDAKQHAEGSSETPVIQAEEVDDIRDKMTKARADIVSALLEDHFD